MATISSTFKMQDNATKTFNSVASAMDTVLDRADAVVNKTSAMESAGRRIAPSLSGAISKYQELMDKQDQINAKIEMMSRQEKLLQADLVREKGAYNQNEKAIYRIEKSLMNVQNQKKALIGQSDKLTNEIYEQAGAVNQVARNTRGIKGAVQNAEQGFSKWQTKVIAINQGLQLTKSIAGGVGKVLNFTDDLTLTKARLDLMNDGLQTTEELQDKIFKSAQRSRGSYEDMSKSVAKLGLLAGDAFKNNDEMVAFSEMMNKSFKVSGASNQEISSATYQLTQAMAAGKLQGDEFRSIMENAPMLADAIAKYMGKSKGELKELSSEGVITSDIIKNALFSSADEINEKFDKMPKTFGDAMTSIKNNAQRSLQPVADKISAMLNSQQFQSGLNIILNGIKVFANGAIAAFTFIGNAIKFFKDNMWLTIPIITALGIVLLGTLVPALWASVTALAAKVALWALAHWQLLLVAAVIGVVVGALLTMNPVLWGIVAVLGVLLVIYALWQVAQWAVNSAMYACPIVWIIVLVIALIAAIYLFMQWMAKATGLAGSGLGMIAGGVNVVIQFFKNLGLMVANIGLGMWNVLKAVCSNIGTAFHNVIANIKSWFYGLLSTALTVVEGICKALNKLPFVDFDYSGITNKAKEYANKAKEAEDSKEDYKDLMSEFDKGMNTFETFQDGWVQDAFSSGAAWGDNIANKIGDAIGSFDPKSMLGNLLGDATKGEDPGQGYDFGSMIDPNVNVPVDIKKNSDKEVDISDEDLKMLKDIATREYMLNYKHVTPNVNISFGDVKETADVNAVKDELERMMEEELAELYVVEEA